MSCSRCCVGVCACVGASMRDPSMLSILSLAVLFYLSDMCRSFWPRSSLTNMIIHRAYRDTHKTDGQGGGQGRRGERKGKGRRKGKKEVRVKGKEGVRHYQTHLVVWLVKRRNAELKGEKQVDKPHGETEGRKCCVQVGGMRLSGFGILFWTLGDDPKVHSMIDCGLQISAVQHHTCQLCLSET